ncbi:MAG TPA: hypothetical protein PLM07_10440 [Candidatus Rifleibacterium sp.]|nr:hypothetical protein [Candidatus Rifleibacterium sp.]HPT46308.1 hypothetical protein [Candidatus Rifleibacterium sp.]
MNYLFIDASENTTLAQTGSEEGFKQQIFATDRNFAARITLICDEMLQNAGLSREEVQMLAVCTGPGSLTGLRVAAAFMRTAAMLLDKPLAGISLFAWSLQTLADQGITGPVRLVMPTLIDKAFEVWATLPAIEHTAPVLIERSEVGNQPQTWGIRFAAPGITCMQPEAASLHKLLTSGGVTTAKGLKELLDILPLYVIPSQAERKFKEAS